MASNPLRNVSLRMCRKFLVANACVHHRTSGGHEHWSRSDLLRPISLQTHIDPVPERIMKQILQALKITPQEFKQQTQKRKHK